LAVPRLLRIAYPAVWVEDDLYLQSAFNIASGLRPYVDFIHPQMPLLEWCAAVFIKIAGASHRSFEMLNGAAIYLTSVLVYALGAKAFDRRTGIAGSLLFACSSLVFRYHVFAREFFADACVLGACLVLVQEEIEPLLVALLGLLLGVALTIKLTVGIEAAAIFGFLLIALKQPRRTIAAGAIALGVVGIVGAVAYALYGYEFFYQTVLFHFLKGWDTAGSGAAYVLRIIDVLGPLLCLGVARIVIRRELARPVLLTLITGGSSWLFYTFVSPTGWAHNYLEGLPFAAIIAGSGLVWAVDRFKGVEFFRHRRLVSIVTASAWIVACLFWITPLHNENWFHGSVYGFGFVPRDELRQLSEGLQRTTPANAIVIAPMFVSFEANRVGLLRYPENVGVVRDGEAIVRTRGFAAARQELGRADFFELINSTSKYWVDLLTSSAAVGGPVNAIILDSPLQLLPLVDAPPDALTARGFEPALTTNHFVLWTRERAR
jgi:hypothetical protein